MTGAMGMRKLAVSCGTGSARPTEFAHAIRRTARSARIDSSLHLPSSTCIRRWISSGFPFARSRDGLIHVLRFGSAVVEVDRRTHGFKQFAVARLDWHLLAHKERQDVCIA